MFMSAAGNIREPQNLRRGNEEFEGVSEFKYFRKHNRGQKPKQ